jgi:hypothetical protein
VTLNISSTGVFIGCRRPLRLNEVFDMVITTPEQDIGAKAEVVWSNKYGPDDHITPRGMGSAFWTSLKRTRDLSPRQSTNTTQQIKKAKI